MTAKYTPELAELIRVRQRILRKHVAMLGSILHELAPLECDVEFVLVCPLCKFTYPLLNGYGDGLALGIEKGVPSHLTEGGAKRCAGQGGAPDVKPATPPPPLHPNTANQDVP